MGSTSDQQMFQRIFFYKHGLLWVKTIKLKKIMNTGQKYR